MMHSYYHDLSFFSLFFLFAQLVGSLYGQIQQFRLSVTAPNGGSDPKQSTSSTDQEDFLCSGNIIGEIGLLTGSRRTCSVSCETAVQVGGNTKRKKFEKL